MPYKDKKLAKQRNRERYLKRREQILAQTKKYYEEHKESQRAKQKAWRQAHREQMNSYSRNFAKRHPERVKQRNKKYKDRLRDECFSAYGNKCFCCGEWRKEFLAMDHVKGGGNKHRKNERLRGGGTIHLYLKRHNYPKGFRLSCSNCNSARGYFGYCPHEREKSVDESAFPLELYLQH